MIAGAALSSLFWVAVFGARMDAYTWPQAILLGYAAMIGGLLIMFGIEDRKTRRGQD